MAKNEIINNVNSNSIERACRLNAKDGIVVEATVVEATVVGAIVSDGSVGLGDGLAEHSLGLSTPCVKYICINMYAQSLIQFILPDNCRKHDSVAPPRPAHQVDYLWSRPGKF